MDEQTTLELLCACLSLDPQESTPSKLAQLSDTDWRHLLRTADAHRVTPLLAHTLKESTSAEFLPQEVARILRETWLTTALRNTQLTQGLNELLTALDQAQIPAILLKGSHLANAVYANIGLRPMSDVDLLVHHRDVVRTGELLLGLGYTTSSLDWRNVASAATHHLLAFLKTGVVPVEVHWRLFAPVGRSKQVKRTLRIDDEGLWRRAQQTRVCGAPVRLLSPVDLLLHLCLHTPLYEKDGTKLRGYCDIALTIAHCGDTIDWHDLIERAQAWRAAHSAFLSLGLARDLVGATVPQWVLDSLTPRSFDTRIREWAIEQLVYCGQSRQEELPHVQNLARVRDTEGIGRRVARALATIFAPREIIARQYPQASHPVWGWTCYVRRVWDLARKYTVVLWRMARHDDTVLTVVDRDSRANALNAWLSES